jgi:hypothetical protein
MAARVRRYGRSFVTRTSFFAARALTIGLLVLPSSTIFSLACAGSVA